MTAFYNEIDPRAAAWLRELIARGVIAPGVVDERDIRDVRPDELAGYTQCHFFAGIGVWSYALRLAGWPDDRPVWTGSCPCQPFSSAGRGAGLADERHLWPAWFHLIRQREPVAVFGEQVSGGDGLAWLDVVRPDMEAAAYAFGCADLCAPGVGAPNLRQRIYFVADTDSQRRQSRRPSEAHGRATSKSSGCCEAGSVADAQRAQRGPKLAEHVGDRHERWREAASGPAACGQTGDMGIATSSGRQRQRDQSTHGQPMPAGPTNGFWSAADWLPCRDGKARPVEPGTFPLVDGAPARVVRLRGYGNSINAWVAEAFISAYLEVICGGSPK